MYVAVSGPVTLDVTVNVVIVKTPVVDPAGTTITRGSDRFGSELLIAIMAAAAAGALSVTVQVEVARDPRVVGLHCNDEITVTADRLRFTLWELAL